MEKSSVEMTLGHRLAGPRLLIGVIAVCAGLALFLNYSSFGALIFEHLVLPMNFNVRHAVGISVKLDPRIKILSLDDSTASWLKNSALTNRQWAHLISGVDRRRPDMIFVDKVFRLPDGQKSSPQDLRKMQKMFSELRTKRVAGAFAADRAIKSDEPMTLTGASFQVATYLGTNTKPQWLDVDVDRFAYGPYGIMRRAFSDLGHIHYEANGWMRAFIGVDNSRVLPHVSLYVAEQINVHGNTLKFADQDFRVDSKGRMLLNFSHPSEYWKRAVSLKPYLINSLQQNPLKEISKKDVVVIVPFMYTGNTDFKWTPFGQAPGAFAHIAAINSALTKTWLTPLRFESFIYFLLIVLTACAGYFLTPLLALGSVGLVCAGFAGLQLYLFTYSNVYSYWLIPTTSAGLAGLSIVLIKLFRERHRALTLRSTLDGMIPQQNLDQLVQRMTPLNFEAREHVLTSMFVDVVGYSLLAENQVPRIAFNHLKNLLKDITKQVHAHGGIVNKTLGDGLLCLFGYDFADNAVVTDHAEKAVLCAIKIQEANLKRNLKAFSQGEPVYPLRIGIHTASVFLGNIGIGDRLDFTAVGNGVNFAKRLEGACEMHSIMFSGTTKDLVASLEMASAGLTKRLISIKHHTNQIEAYEYDPFYSQPDQRARALEAYRQCASLARMEQRFSINHPDHFVIQSSSGGGVIINYSATGMSIKLKSMLMKGSTLVVNVDSQDGHLARQLQELGVKELKGEVRWVYSESDGHVHGLFFRELSEKDSLRLVELIKAFDLQVKRSNISRIEKFAS